MQPSGSRSRRPHGHGPVWLAFSVTCLAACGRSVPLPDFAGSLTDVIVDAGMHGVDRAPLPLLLDSLAFGRLGTVAGDVVYSSTDIQRQVRRDVTLVDPGDVLECPSREPCRLRDDGVFLTVWGVVLTRDVLSVVVSRAWNVEGTYTMTRHETRLLELRGAGGAWRLTSSERL